MSPGRRSSLKFTILLLAVSLAAPAAALAAPARLKVALLPLQARDGVDPVLAAVLTEALAVELAGRPGLSVITPKDVEAALGFEKQKAKVNAAVAAQTGDEVCTDNSCLQEIGGALGVERMISGTIARLGSSWILNVQSFDSRKAQVLKRYFTRVTSDQMDALLDVVPAAAEDLFPGGESRPSSMASAPATAPAAPVAPAPVQSAPSPEMELARKCSARDGESCLRLAQSQEAAGGATAETVGLLVKACDFKVAAACTLAADAIGQGKVADPDPSRAAELHARSCELRATTTGCETVAAYFRDGAHVEKDLARAQELFAQACTAGSVGACNSAAELALGRDESAALTAWKKGCELGSAEACTKHTELDLRRTKLAAALKVEAERKEKKENQTFWRRAGYVSGGIGVAAGGASGLLAFLGSQRNESLRAGDYDDFGDQDFAVSTGTPLNIGAWGFAAISTVAVGTALGLVLFNLEDEDDGGLINPKASIVVAPSSVTLQLGGF